MIVKSKIKIATVLLALVSITGCASVIPLEGGGKAIVFNGKMNNTLPEQDYASEPEIASAIGVHAPGTEFQFEPEPESETTSSPLVVREFGQKQWNRVNGEAGETLNNASEASTVTQSDVQLKGEQSVWEF